MPYMTCMSLFACCDLSFVLHLFMPCHTNFAIYAVNEMVASTPILFNVKHTIHDLHVKIFMWWPVIYVRRTLMSRYSTFSIEMATSTPILCRVNHAIQDLHVMIFILRTVVYVHHTLDHAMPYQFGIYIQSTKQPRVHQDHGMQIMLYMTCLSWFSCYDLFMFVKFMSRPINFGIYIILTKWPRVHKFAGS